MIDYDTERRFRVLLQSVTDWPIHEALLFLFDLIVKETQRPTTLFPSTSTLFQYKPPTNQVSFSTTTSQTNQEIQTVHNKPPATWSPARNLEMMSSFHQDKFPTGSKRSISLPDSVEINTRPHVYRLETAPSYFPTTFTQNSTISSSVCPARVSTPNSLNASGNSVSTPPANWTIATQNNNTNNSNTIATANGNIEYQFTLPGSLDFSTVTTNQKLGAGKKQRRKLLPEEEVPLDLSFPQVVIVDAQSDVFKEKLLLFVAKEGTFPFACKVCGPNKPQTLIVRQNANMKVSCQHYVACNECRGRTVRRLLRCPSCSFLLTNCFPTCGTRCVDKLNDKEATNTGSCPRCMKKLKKETCGIACNRRTTIEYGRARASLNKQVAILVLNPAIDELWDPDSTFRPCSHYSRCPVHNLIAKGHSKDISCKACKRSKTKLKLSHDEDEDMDPDEEDEPDRAIVGSVKSENYSHFSDDFSDDSDSESSSVSVKGYSSGHQQAVYDSLGADFAEMYPVVQSESEHPPAPGELVFIVPGDNQHRYGYVSRKCSQEALWMSIVSSHPVLIGNLPHKQHNVNNDVIYRPIILLGHCPILINVENRDHIKAGELVLSVHQSDQIPLVQCKSRTDIRWFERHCILATVVRAWNRSPNDGSSVLVDCIFVPPQHTLFHTPPSEFSHFSQIKQFASKNKTECSKHSRLLKASHGNNECDEKLASIHYSPKSSNNDPCACSKFRYETKILPPNAPCEAKMTMSGNCMELEVRITYIKAKGKKCKCKFSLVLDPDRLVHRGPNLQVSPRITPVEMYQHLVSSIYTNSLLVKITENGVLLNSELFSLLCCDKRTRKVLSSTRSSTTLAI